MPLKFQNVCSVFITSNNNLLLLVIKPEPKNFGLFDLSHKLGVHNNINV